MRRFGPAMAVVAALRVTAAACPTVLPVAVDVTNATPMQINLCADVQAAAKRAVTGPVAPHPDTRLHVSVTAATRTGHELRCQVRIELVVGGTTSGTANGGARVNGAGGPALDDCVEAVVWDLLARAILPRIP